MSSSEVNPNISHTAGVKVTWLLVLCQLCYLVFMVGQKASELCPHCSLKSLSVFETSDSSWQCLRASKCDIEHIRSLKSLSLTSTGGAAQGKITAPNSTVSLRLVAWRCYSKHNQFVSYAEQMDFIAFCCIWVIDCKSIKRINDKKWNIMKYFTFGLP